VLVVGIPFPPVFDPRVLLKKAHLCKQSQWKAKMAKAQGTPTRTIMNAEEWYKIEGTRAVNQALGRIIRHKDVSAKLQGILF
jgi:Rad3-related DNA helicase